MARVVIPYTPRDVFKPYHNRTNRFASIVAHRRAGKTVATINDQIKRAIEFQRKDGRFAYIAPFRQQAKDVAWSYLKFYTAPLPGIEVSESELHVTLPTGSRIRLYGSDNYDAMRGIYLDGVIMDEFADHHPQAWREVVRPALADRQGWATFIGTSKGKNAFYDMQVLAESNPDWFAARMKASETGLLPASELKAMRETMSANEYAREMECDFDAAIEGAYFADLLTEARRQDRIGRVSKDPNLAIRVYCDLGGAGAKADAFTMWACQFIGQEIRVLDYYEAQGQPAAEHFAWLRDRGYQRAEVFLPHDGLTQSGPGSASWEATFKDAGFSASTLRSEGSGAPGARSVRIEAVRRLLPRVWFNEATCKGGLDALTAYAEKRDEKRGIGLGPDHNWASHGADAFGLMAVDYREPSTSWTGAIKYKVNPI